MRRLMVFVSMASTVVVACTEGASLSGVSSSPETELAALDTRQPVPLQPMMAWHQKQNMMEHLVAIQAIIDGTAREDWVAVEKAARRIGSSPQTQQMCEHMGAGSAGFAEAGVEFHRRADRIVEAATRANGQDVLSFTAATLSACTACHAAYRQDVVDADTWTERTKR